MNDQARIPSLEVYREVTNIGEEDVAYLEGDAIMRNPSLSPAAVHRVFAGGGVKLPLRTPIVGRMEMIWFYETIGHVPESEDEVRKLKSYVHDVLPASANEPITTPTLPAYFYEEGPEEAPLATLPEVWMWLASVC